MSKVLHVTAVIWPEGDRFVAKCPEVGVASYGATTGEARKALREAIKLWAANARELGLMDDVAPAVEHQERYSTPPEVAV